MVEHSAVTRQMEVRVLHTPQKFKKIKTKSIMITASEARTQTDDVYTLKLNTDLSVIDELIKEKVANGKYILLYKPLLFERYYIQTIKEFLENNGYLVKYHFMTNEVKIEISW